MSALRIIRPQADARHRARRGSGIKSVSLLKLLSSIRYVFQAAAPGKLRIVTKNPVSFCHRRGLGGARKPVVVTIP
jgi:hypothetical protein